MHVSMLLMHSLNTRSKAHIICGGGIAGKNSLVGPTALAGTRPLLLANLYVLEGLLQNSPLSTLVSVSAKLTPTAV